MYHIMGQKMLKSTLIGAILLCAAQLSAAAAHAAELVMFERDGCVWCARWDRDVGQIYPKTDEARLLPLRRINMDHAKEPGLGLASPVRFTPTFVVIDQGREVGRITGYINDDSFWGLLGALAAKVTPPPRRGHT
ncbi:thioredoxin-like protein [Rhodopseudomonas thermotolerans]|uniref:Thioredoxin-like protein n=2 Tax=Rhodopseudomonas TaxID=1073 RepID=A0A336JXA8_9BRAD|nr:MULTISPECIES: thioredoxin fold domain-containing protein [Rhodopseudomonas]RED36121.1 thioredoxin-like protein [Rhodopseudomonas pentothenatexigens]REG03493.1 thioredoxin-like protein [Rhodopseudomonas thermotolerans]SSW90681.1 thioredoxin-like protein [Rhodopseudomonas pentothenatexigens]